ncbi:antibiotic biosynthesis monooxygenase [Actinocorallia populi]|uniref:antibiotic biosynthesis monooxygenase n=1 Tax=Actinocorallia populi TaxID=2079200 RepID=UPI000D090DCD|nr:antibiotic biosynthesis monooxygenase [Actinocorallia populi]
MTDIPDVKKSTVVDVPVGDAFTLFVERPVEWFPEHHVFVKDRVDLVIEPRVGGLYYDVDADGTEIAWGTVTEFDPPRRIVFTWRVGPGWRPILDDDRASFIEVDFEPAVPRGTKVSITHSGLHRHGPELAPAIHAALDGPSPGETLARFAEVVVRHSAPVTLLNRFTLNDLADAERFEEAFETTSAYFASQPGFIEHTLMKQTDEPGSYVNFARWESEAALRAAVSQPGFRPHAGALRALAVSDPKVYSPRFTTTPSTAKVPAASGG